MICRQPPAAPLVLLILYHGNFFLKWVKLWVSSLGTEVLAFKNFSNDLKSARKMGGQLVPL